jgi:hypothetical protein
MASAQMDAPREVDEAHSVVIRHTERSKGDMDTLKIKGLPARISPPAHPHREPFGKDPRRPGRVPAERDSCPGTAGQGCPAPPSDRRLLHREPLRHPARELLLCEPDNRTAL